MTQHIALIEEIENLRKERNLLRTRIEVMVDAWPEFDDDDEPVDGAELVEWWGQEREKCKKVLASTPLEGGLR
jgi:hypothetical protein